MHTKTFWPAAVALSVLTFCLDSSQAGPPPGATPIVLTCSTNITVTASGSSGGAYVTYSASVSGVCAPVAAFDPPSGSFFAVGTTIVSCTATDTCGNTANCSFQVTVNPPPTVMCPTNIAVATGDTNGAVVNFTAGLTGGCAPITFTASPYTNGAVFPVGITYETVDVYDCNGYEGYCSFTVTVVASAISLNCPSNITVTASGPSGAVVFFTATATGGCSPPPMVTANPPSGSTFPIGTTTVLVSASDNCGTSTNCSFTVTVNPPNPPPIDLTCPTNIMVTVTNASSATVYFNVFATGGCSPPPNVYSYPPSGSSFAVGTTTVNSTASDSCGNFTNCSFTVTVVSTNNNCFVSIYCPSNIVVTSSVPATVYFNVNASDSCGGFPTITANPPSGSTFPLGTTTVFSTAYDANGTNSCSFTVTVVRPASAPIVLNCLSNFTVNASSSSGATVFFGITASGGCSPPPGVMANPPSGSMFPIGTTTVFVTASDTCGNSTNCSFQVTVVRPPIVLNCSSNIAVAATSSSGAIIFYSVSATGGCSPPPMIMANPPSGSTFPIGTTTVFVTASDTCATTTNCSFTVTVTNVPIVLNCSSNLTVTATGPSGATVFFTASASGGCSPPPSLMANPPSGSTFPIGTTTVNVTASDTCGSSTNCSFTVTVSPQPNPQADLQVTKTVTTDAVFVGGPAGFSIGVTNLGPDTSSNIIIADLLPAGLAYSSSGVPGDTSFNSTNGTWTIPQLAPGNGYSLALTALASGAGTFTNTATLMTSTPPDTNGANNTASAVVTATVQLLQADLQVVKTVSSYNSPVGSQVVFTVQLSNLGPNNVTNSVVVTDCLPSGYQYVTDSTVGGVGAGTYSPGTCQWTLPAGVSTNAMINLNITTLAITGGTYTNTAAVAVPAGYTDPNLNNNTSSVVVKIYPVYNLSGYVRGCQSNGPAIPFTTVSLSGTASSSTLTDTNGFYVFSNLVSGTYVVKLTQPGNVFNPASATVALNSNTNLPVFMGSVGQIRGRLSYGTNGAAIASALVNLTGPANRTVMTDANGIYAFTNAQPGSYTVTPVATNGYVFTPTNAAVTISATNCVAQANFVTAQNRTVLLVAIEVNQAIQDWSNSVPLVQDKATVVRTFFQLPNATNPPVLLQGARLHGTSGGSALPGSPLSPMNSNGVFLVQTTNAAAGRSQLINSLNFRLPAAWLAGTVTLRFECTNNVTVIPTNVVPANSSVAVTFAPVAVPQVKWFGINWVNVTGQPQNITLTTLQSLADRLRATYPVARVDSQFIMLTLDTNSLWGNKSSLGDGSANGYPGLSKLNNALALVRILDSFFLPVGNRIYYGALAGLDYTGSGPTNRPPFGQAIGVPGPTASGFVPMDPYGWAGPATAPGRGYGRQTASHEIGHDLGLQHDLNGSRFGYATRTRIGTKWVTVRTTNIVNNASNRTVGAYGRCSEVGPTNSIYPLFQPFGATDFAPAIGVLTNGVNALVYGLDTLTLDTTNKEPVLSPFQYFDLMSYCRGGLEDRWAGVFTYNFLQGAINGNFSGPPPTPPLDRLRRWLFVRGTVDELNVNAEFQPFVAVDTADVPPSPPPGDYSLILRDANFNVIGTISFAPTPGDDEDDSEDPLDDFIIPIPIDLASQPVPIRDIQVTDGINLLAEIYGSTNFPSVSGVTVTGTNGSTFSGSGWLVVHWTGFDADPLAQLTYTVQYSSAGGTNWQTLATDLSGNSYSLDSIHLAPAAQGQIRVIVSDGFNVSDPAYSPQFPVNDHPPLLSLYAPMDGTIFVGDQQVYFSAAADDAQDGPLTGNSLQWNSSRDGQLGAGETLTLEADLLSEGTHVITVTALDSAGLSASAQAVIHVLRQSPPLLAIQQAGNQFQLSWSSSVTNYVLEVTPSLLPMNWTAVTNVPVAADLLQTVNLNLSTTNQFFRLRMP